MSGVATRFQPLRAVCQRQPVPVRRPGGVAVTTAGYRRATFEVGTGVGGGRREGLGRTTTGAAASQAEEDVV